MDEALSEKYSRAKDYPMIAKEAIKEMVRQVGTPKFNEKGMLIKDLKKLLFMVLLNRW